MEKFLTDAVMLATLNTHTYPNPRVGAVIVKNDEIIGVGTHLKAGAPHAEVMAIQNAIQPTEGATIYVSLEPCSHYGKTPPCTQAIIDAGIIEVIYAYRDPSLFKSGHDILLEHGVNVRYEPHVQATEIYDEFFSIKQPKVTVKISVSLDGRQANDNGISKWITGPDVKKDVLHMRKNHEVIITGANTIREDLPTLTSRVAETPHRVILTHSGNLPYHLPMFHDINHPVEIITSNSNIQLPTTTATLTVLKDTHIDTVIHYLKQNYSTIMIEAGKELTRQSLNSAFVNEIIIYYAPKLIGGSGVHQFYQTDHIDFPTSTQFKIVSSKLIGEDLKVTLKRK